MAVLYADGGTLGASPSNRGIYWSVGTAEGVAGRWTDATGRRKRSDEAEYLALYTALWLALQLGEAVTVRMDCWSVVQAVKYRKPPRAYKTRQLYDAVLARLAQLRAAQTPVTLEWVARRNVKKILGH